MNLCLDKGGKVMKKILSVFLISVMILCFASGCSKNEATQIATYSGVEASDNGSEIYAENDNYRLKWDSEMKRVLLEDKSEGHIYSNVPFEALETKVDEYGMAIDNFPKLESAVCIEYVEQNTKNKKTSNGSIILKNGDYNIQNQKNGLVITYDFEKLEISVPVKYVLEEDGILIQIDPKAIKEKGTDYKIVGVQVAPFMCSVANNSTDSYLFYPSGSGALIYPDIEQDVSSTYSSPVYGPDRTVYRQSKNLESIEEPIRMPVFGAKYGNRGIAGIIENGAAASQISLDVGNKNIGFSGVYVTYNLRGKQHVVNQYSNSSADAATRYSEEFCNEPLSVKYYPLKGEDASYFGMAKLYRNYLAEKYNMKTNNESYKLSLKVIGGAMIDTTFLGINRRELFELTTLEEAKIIIDEVSSKLNGNLQVELEGFGVTGLETSKIAGGFDIAKSLGGKNGLQQLYKSYSNSKVDIFTDFDLIGFSKSGNGYSTTFDVAVSVTKQKIFESYGRYLGIGTQVSPTRYLLNRDLTLDIAKELLEKLDSWEINGIALDTISSTVYSDYGNKKYYCNGAVESDFSKIYTVYKSHKKKMLSNAANSYVAAVSDAITDAPLQSTNHDLFDADIPFYELVFSGYIPMNSTSLNLTNTPESQMLRCVESGCGLSYTVMKNYDTKLRLEQYTDVFNACSYDDIKNNIFNNIEKTNEYYEAVSGSEIVNHTLISETLRKTEFANGTIVYVNYGDDSVETEIGRVEQRGFIYKEGTSK